MSDALPDGFLVCSNVVVIPPEHLEPGLSRMAGQVVAGVMRRHGTARIYRAGTVLNQDAAANLTHGFPKMIQSAVAAAVIEGEVLSDSQCQVTIEAIVRYLEGLAGMMPGIWKDRSL